MKTALHQPSPDFHEWKLVLACSRTRLDDLQRSRIRELLDRPLRWALVADLGAKHRVDALLAWHLAGEFSEWVPREALVSLGAAARTLGQWSLRLTAEMLRLMEAFENAGLSVVPYKGPTLAMAAYGNVALRYSDDLDFVLPQRDLPRAFALLLEAGLQSELDPSNPRHDRFLRRGNMGQYLLRIDAARLPVELHTEKTMRYFPSPLDWDGLQSRMSTVSIGGRSHRVFSTEDLLVLLSVHGAKHFWNRLSWTCDIAELTQVPQGIDWELSERLARRAGCRRMWLLGLSLAHGLLDAPLPERVLRWIAADSGVRALEKRIALGVEDRQGASGGVGERLRFRMLAHETRLDGLRQCLRVTTQITEDDWRDLSLPAWAEALYMAVRPWRLLCKYGLNLRHGAAPKHVEE